MDQKGVRHLFFFELEFLKEFVTPENVDRFLEDVDLLIDAVDFFAFDARRMLFREAARRGIWVVTAGPIGFSTAWLAFDPKGMSFDNYFDLRDGMAAVDQFAAFAIGLAPRSTHIPYFDFSYVDQNGRGPSVAAPRSPPRVAWPPESLAPKRSRFFFSGDTSARRPVTPNSTPTGVCSAKGGSRWETETRCNASNDTSSADGCSPSATESSRNSRTDEWSPFAPQKPHQPKTRPPFPLRPYPGTDFGNFRGRPRGRIVDSSPNLRATDSTQLSSPKGTPRFMLQSICRCSDSEKSVITHRFQSSRREIGQGLRSFSSPAEGLFQR